MIETQIDDKLWKSIRKNYEVSSYSEAIIDAIYYLSNMVRDKTGLESDGVVLVGQALGGSQPLIKVNSLQTESEINVQKGLEQILRGIFQAIRNPRSHERYEDSQKDADAIIIFIDYICKVIDQSKTQFSETEFLSRVFDKNFVANERYSELLVEEIPKRKRLNVAIEVYKKKETGDGNKLSHFFKVILSQFDEGELNRFFEVVSEELTKVSDEKIVRCNLQVIPFHLWMKVKEVARIRIENMLMESIKDGRYYTENNLTNGGALGTWIAWGNVKYMTFVDDFVGIFIKKLGSKDKSEADYVFKYFWEDLISNINEMNQHFLRVLKKKLKEGDRRFYQKLNFYFFVEGYENWIVRAVKQEYENFSEKKDDNNNLCDEELPF